MSKRLWVDNEEGAVLGDDVQLLTMPKPSDQDKAENWEANQAANECGEAERDMFGFLWTSKAAATKALEYIKTVMKQKQEEHPPMPDWAKEALKAGWKPPKGWRA